MSNPPNRGKGNPPNRGNGIPTAPGEELLLILIAVGALGFVLASAGALWLKGSAWLVEHKVLVPATAEPMIQVPGTAGAGLDLPRMAIAAALLLAALAVVASRVRRAIRLARREELE